MPASATLRTLRAARLRWPARLAAVLFLGAAVGCCEAPVKRRPERHRATAQAAERTAARCAPGTPAGELGGSLVPNRLLRLGPAVTLLEPGALGLEYMPDSGVAVLGRDPFRLLLTARDSIYLLEGQALDSLATAKRVLAPGPPGSFDNGYVGIGGVVHAPDGRLYLFYSAEDRQGMPALASGAPGYHASVGVAVSSDGGRTWEKLGQAVTSERGKHALSYPGQTDTGLGEPGVVEGADGRFVYLYYTDHSRAGGRGVAIGMARADLQEGPPVPGRWRKLYAGAFTEPGIGGRDQPVIDAPRGTRLDLLFPHPVYSRSLGRYLLVSSQSSWDEHQAGPRVPEQSGIAVATSQDGVHWEKPELLIHSRGVPSRGQPIAWEASILWDDAEGRTGWLVYGYSPCWGAGRGRVPHFMVGRRLELAGR